MSADTEGPVYLPATLVYEGFFDVFETQPLIGRWFRTDEHVSGSADVAVLGYKVWRTRFGGDERIVGRSVTLDERAFTVVGVMPESFSIPSNDTVWLPKVLAGWEQQSRAANFYTVYGRLAATVTAEAAHADLERVARQLAEEYPTTNAAVGVEVVALPDHVLGRVRRALWLLVAAVTLVLLVVAANVASMQLARAAARNREFSLRAALGAGAGRVARQLLAENLIVAAIATLLASLVAAAALNALLSIAPQEVPRASEIRADRFVFVFATALTFLSVVLTGVAPALMATRSRLQSDLAQGGRTATPGLFVSRLQAGLVILQFCASLVLLVGAGLLLRSFISILDEEPGFRTDGIAVVTVQSWSFYKEPMQRVQFVRAVENRLGDLSGVRGVGVTSSVPLMQTIGAEQSPLTIVGAPPLRAGENAPLTNFVVLTPGTFSVLGIPLKAGRLLEATDDVNAVPVAVVNEAFVRRHLSNDNAIGEQLILGNVRGSFQQTPVQRQIVGIVGDVRRIALHEPPRPTVYLPHAQLPVGANAFLVWSDSNAADLLRRMKEAVWAVNGSIPIYAETSLRELFVSAHLKPRKSAPLSS
jgi:putative ABC transport system permease protein